jgi:hypothetical protein
MQNYIKLFREQLDKLPNSGYKLQLTKHGENVVNSIFKRSIIDLIAEITITGEDIKHTIVEHSFSNVVKPVNLLLSHDLGVCEELIYNMDPNFQKISEASTKLAYAINNQFMNNILTFNFKTLESPINVVLEKREYPRVIIVGNNTIKQLPSIVDSYDLKFITNSINGDPIFHSNHIPTRVVFTIDLNPEKKALEYIVRNPLTVENNHFKHSTGMYLKNSDAITKYFIEA